MSFRKYLDESVVIRKDGKDNWSGNLNSHFCEPQKDCDYCEGKVSWCVLFHLNVMNPDQVGFLRGLNPLSNSSTLLFENA